jgi:hypothetical protein
MFVSFFLSLFICFLAWRIVMVVGTGEWDFAVDTLL